MKKLFYLPALVLMFLPMSCSDQLDINTDPLAASTSDPNAVLPYILVQYSFRHTTEMTMRTLDVYQNTSVTIGSPRRGRNSNFLSGNTWNNLYVQVMGNAERLEADAKATGPSSNNIAAIALILKALAFHDLTLVWSDVPFTQALDPVNFSTPEFDDQETVLRGILIYLDEAIAMIDAMPATGNFNVSQGDLIYAGDMMKWRRYANSMKLRILMIIRNKDTSVDTEILQTLNEPLIESSDDAMLLKYPGTPDNTHGFFRRMQNVGFTSNEEYNFWGPSQVMRDLLEGDPRLQLWCVDGTDGGFEASDIGRRPDATKARYSDNVIRPDRPDIWYLPAEVSLYKAELAIKGVAVPGGTANDFYREGVTKSLKFHGQDIPGAIETLSDSEINDFVNSLPDINTLTTAESLTSIGEEQYLDGFLRAVETWTQVRRTKIPDIQAAPGATITTMLKRFFYPPLEIGANPNVPPNLATDTPMWFEN